MTQKELRAIRLKNDYELMKNMKSKVINFTVDNPEKPEQYVVTFHIRTIVDVDSAGKPVYRDTSVVDITFPPEYPEAKPKAVMREKQPLHVNWYRDRSWCCGHWFSDEPLWSYVRRMAKTIQFDPKYTNVKSPANMDAIPFWNNNQRYFPTDTQQLPTSEKKKSRIVIHQ